MANNNFHILDVTIRDGSYQVDFQYTPDQVEIIVRLLDAAGVTYIEGSHGLGIGASKLGVPIGADDLAYAKAAKRGRNRAKLGVIGHFRSTTTDDISRLLPYIDFFRIMVNVNEPEKGRALIEHSKKNGLETFAQMTRTSSVSPKMAAESAKQLFDVGADIVYLVDTAGCLIPGELASYTKAIHKKVKKPRLGFHAHNTFQIATATTLEAIDLGFEMVDASLLGLGRDAGNVDLGALVAILQRKKIDTRISLRKIIEAAESIRPFFKEGKRPPSWTVLYLASFQRDINPLHLIDFVATECNRSPFDVIEAFAALPNVVECGVNDIRDLIEKLGGDVDAIFKKYQIKPTL